MNIKKVINLDNERIKYIKKGNGEVSARGLKYEVLDSESKDVIKGLELTVWGDFNFYAWTNEEKTNKIDFTIDKNNPLYETISETLKKKNKIVKFDRSIEENTKSSIKISKDEKDNINIVFETRDLDNEENKYDEIRVISTSIGKTKVAKDFLNNIDILLAPRETLEHILMPENIFGRLPLKEEDKETVLRIIPELQDEIGFKQNNPWHIYDVWEHTLAALERSNSDLEIRLTMLLHDIGKPYSYQEDGEIRHFKGHASKSAEISKTILKRLGYDEEEINRICYLISNHATIINPDSVNYNNLDLTNKLLKVQYYDAYAYNPQYGIPMMKKLEETKQKIKEKIQGFDKNTRFWKEEIER